MGTPQGTQPHHGAEEIAGLTGIGGREGSLADRVYDALREAILDLTLPPGAALRKAALCARLGVSRSPVAAAITRLAAEGLVEVVPQSGTRVSRFSLAELREETFLRDAVETAAVAKVAAGRDAGQLARLERILRLQERLVAAHDFRGFLEADEAFHALTLEFTGLPKVAAVAGQVSLQLRRARLLLLPEEGRPAEAVAEHAAILQAIRDGDADAAAAAMRHHLGQLMSRLEPLERRHPEFFGARRGAPHP